VRAVPARQSPVLFAVLLAFSIAPVRGTLAAVEIVYDSIDNNSNLVIDAFSTNWQGADLTVGAFGTNNLLHILNAGELTNAELCVIGSFAQAGHNLALIEGTGSLLHAHDIRVGGEGSSNRMRILNGGAVNHLGGDAYLGFGVDSQGNEVTVDGPGSLWQLNALNIGQEGRFNTLTVTNGGSVYCGATCYIGYDSTATGNAIVVTGAGSTFDSDTVYFGQASSRNRLTVSGGGAVTSRGALRLGAGNTVDNEILIEGAGSQFHVDADINAMYDNASHHRLIIRDGGRLDNASGYFGWSSSAVSNAALVTGAGSVWSNRGALFAGVFAEYTTLIISNGGAVYCQEGIVGSGGGAHNALTVIGTGSLWQCDRAVAVGNGGASNALFIRDGATVQSQGGSLGNVGNSALVTDPGSTWIMSGSLNVGGDASDYYGPGNTLTISNGGVVSAPTAAIGQPNGNAILIGRNGLLIVTNETGDAELTLRGALWLDGGTARVDRVLVKVYDDSGFVTNAWIGGSGTIIGSLLVETGNAVYVESGSRIAIIGVVTNHSVIRGGQTGALDFYGPVINEGYVEDIYGTMCFHAGLQNQGAGILLDSNSARVASLAIAGSNTLLQFLGASNMPYSVSVTTNLHDGQWQEGIGGLTGNGALMTVTNYGAAGAQQLFQKINLSLPDYVP